MKKNLFVLFVSLLVACNAITNRNDAVIKFNQTDYDFGTLAFNAKAETAFEFSNAGKSPLIITDVQTSCGCTVPDWPKEPVKAGKAEKIKIKYDTSHPGHFNKTITVFFNGSESPVTLVIKGDVEYPDETKNVISTH
jgi:hypothetical protein